MSDKKPNCYKCRFRGKVPGSAHSTCNNPILRSIIPGNMWTLMSIANVGLPIDVASDLGVRVNPNGVANGWCNWPFNFDPTWITGCELFDAIHGEQEQKRCGFCDKFSEERQFEGTCLVGGSKTRADSECYQDEQQT